MKSLRITLDNIKRWFKYYPIVSKIVDFDYSSVLEVEKYQLTVLRNNILKYKSMSSWEYDVSRINLAINLLEKYSQNFVELIDGKYQLHIYVNTRNSKRFLKNYVCEQDTILHKEYLYKEKIWKLYYKVREKYTREWWD